MPKRLSKRKPASDPNLSAFRVVQQTTGKQDAEPKPAKVVQLKRPKNAAAVALGRRGGLASAAIRNERISPEKRREIAAHAARKRWGKDEGDS